MKTSRIPLLPYIDQLLHEVLPSDCVKHISTYTAKFIYFNRVNKSYILRVKENRKHKHYVSHHLIKRNYKH